MKDLRVSLFDLAMSLSEAIDLVSPDVANHHTQVAYTAHNIGGFGDWVSAGGAVQR